MPVDRLALLRGINVGGRNAVRMADLRAAFAALGATDVQTYIASGNVLFRGALGAKELEAGLSGRFGLELKVVVRTARQLHAVVAAAPDAFADEAQRCDVVFLRPPLTVDRALGRFDPREGIDRVWPGAGVVYHARLAARASGSRFSVVAGYPEYREMTIRSWTTTRRLAGLLAARGAGPGPGATG